MSDETELPAHPDDATAAVAFGSPARIAILRYLTRHPQALSGDLSRSLGFAQATISTNLSVLEQHGLVAADIPSPSRKGRRARWSANTEECRRLVRHLDVQVTPESPQP